MKKRVSATAPGPAGWAVALMDPEKQLAEMAKSNPHDSYPLDFSIPARMTPKSGSVTGFVA